MIMVTISDVRTMYYYTYLSFCCYFNETSLQIVMLAIRILLMQFIVCL